MQKITSWQEALQYLSKKDKKLAQLIKENKDYKPTFSNNSFESLLHSVVSQQISFKVANNIWNKIIKSINKPMTATNILKINRQILKDCGLSKQKIQYFLNIATHFKEHNINDKNYWQNKKYAEIYAELIKIKGVGEWTIHMFAIYFLRENDIMPIKDLGIINAINKLYKKEDKKLSLEEIISISDKWSPFRSVACLFLWLTVD